MSCLYPSQKAAVLSDTDWEALLDTAPFTAEQRWRSAIEIRRFLRYCAILEMPVSRQRRREYLATVPPRLLRPIAQLALHWFFATIALSPRQRGQPTPS